MAIRLRVLVALGLMCGVVGLAFARGPDMNLPVFGVTPGEYGPGAYEPERPAPRYEDVAPARPAATVSVFGYGKAVCVRLCDGYFFPTASVSGGEAACAAQCPDAPTALYTMPSDRIEDAVSETAAPYSKLPVAKRYQTTFDSTCSCHRDTVASRTQELMTDATLRKGDVVMTPDGFRVYEGDGYGPSGPKDFVALSKAGNVPKAERATLTAMERASAGSRAISAPDRVVTRPKGNVTVDNGSPAATQ